MDVKIEVYVMYPSNEHWIENSKKREDMENIEVYENQKKQMEFPNPAEGFDAIFEVVDDEIILRMRDGTTRHILENLDYWGQEPVGIVL